MSSVQIDWLGMAQALTPRVRNFVNGRWTEPSGEPLEKYGPRDGQWLCRFGAGSAPDVDVAVAGARQAFNDGRWSKRTVQSRKDVLYAFAASIDAHREELALLECLDTGKPISDALNQSGIGVEGGVEGLQAYTRQTAVKVFV